MKKLLLAFTMLIGLITNAQTFSLTGTNPVYTQNFNSLDTFISTASSNLPSGWSIIEINGTSTTAANGRRSNFA